MEDPCLLTKKDEIGGTGMIIIQVHDSLGLDVDAFMKEEEYASTEFRFISRKLILDGEKEFNGSIIRQCGSGMITMTQGTKIDKIKIPDGEKEFVNQRTFEQYIGTSVSPDICAPMKLIAPGNQPIDKAEYNQLTRAIKFLKKTRDIVL